LRLDDTVWTKLPKVADYGFAVFKLKGGRRQEIHPMAFRFPTRDPSRLFFPTVHVHEGRVHEKAEFHHILYFQGPLAGEMVSEGRAGAFVSSARAHNLVDADERVARRVLMGMRANEDTWIDVARAPDRRAA
jgi:hypothetical protein